MAEVKHFKLDAIPDTWEADSIYFIDNGDYAETYVTSATGVPKLVGNSEMINALIALGGGSGEGVPESLIIAYAVAL